MSIGGVGLELRLEFKIRSGDLRSAIVRNLKLRV